MEEEEGDEGGEDLINIVLICRADMHLVTSQAPLGSPEICEEDGVEGKKGDERQNRRDSDGD